MSSWHSYIFWQNCDRIPKFEKVDALTKRKSFSSQALFGYYECEYRFVYVLICVYIYVLFMN